jgi:excinuclease ABC subunit A
MKKLKLSKMDEMIAHQIVKEIIERLSFLVDVGLDYLTLSRAAATLSGGEAQRIRLATQIGSGLTGVLYILDEPTTGLHLADVDQLLKVLFKLRDMGNSVLVIEHNLDVIKTADHIIDIGPEGGSAGGQLIASGTPEAVAKNKNSHTGRYLKDYL